MDGPRGDTELPYGKIAGWGMAASAVVTLGLLALCPLSPARMVEKALDGEISIRPGEPPTSLEGELVAGKVLAGSVEGVLDDARVVITPWGPGLRGELLRDVTPEARDRLRGAIRRGLRLELRGMGPELRGALLEGLLPLVPELTRELDADGSGARVRALSVTPGPAGSL